MGRKETQEGNITREVLLDKIDGSKSENQESERNERRGFIKGAVLSLLGTFGLVNTANTVAAEPGEHVEVSRAKAKKAIMNKQDRIQYLRNFGILTSFNIEKVLREKAKKSSKQGYVQAKAIRGPEQGTEPALEIVAEGPDGEFPMWFPVNNGYLAFDPPSSIDTDVIISNGNDAVTASDCPEGNDGCCCNVSSCDYCYCTNWGYCDCVVVMGQTCHYRVCDCCADVVDYCTRYCGTPSFNNC